ncbi:MAG TPA: hypothetical protein VHQ46_03210 [Desulfobacteria bacterium]|nr:hypothetical protein [Desulfobacteria bacterium]
MHTILIMLSMIFASILHFFGFNSSQLPQISNQLASTAAYSQSVAKDVSASANAISRQIHSSQAYVKTILRSLPKPHATLVQKASNTITIVAGDAGVSRNTVRRATNMVQTYSLPILKQNLNLAPANNVDIVLFSSSGTYANALRKAGVPGNEIDSMLSNTGGITIDSDIWIPLYNLQDRSMLANVLTHELTHVIFNQAGIGDKLPTWINEGMAWYDGLAAQDQINPAETQAIISSLRGDVIKAGRTGKLLPLSASEEDILQASYNVEFEDYIAMHYLIQHQGIAKVQAFFHQVINASVNRSFMNQFQMSTTAFENLIYQRL